ncbi:hypothetical protein D2E25_1108 [Bifidobacterium goeldii]|uniref:Uncharacterized protein n=1 Tax=Bifidobacterium goeldii TaxID=2306975 RepID=A0A430FJR8_9BIFI|nr:hypothetical protein [Bifidobacterium goeldii]RSX53135.1 hypothetical protein D2E25_1108 [Bifidobacterium goeldii]
MNALTVLPSFSAIAANRTPVSEITIANMLVPAMIACFTLAIALTVLIVILSRPRRTPARATTAQGAHRARSATSVWLERISDVVDRNQHGDLSREEAFAQLAGIARAFASEQTGRDLSTATLRDLSAYPHHAGTSGPTGFTLLRQTIEALYPPEFADAALNLRAREISVEQGAEWVSNLVERWRR